MASADVATGPVGGPLGSGYYSFGICGCPGPGLLPASALRSVEAAGYRGGPVAGRRRDPVRAAAARHQPETADRCGPGQRAGHRRRLPVQRGDPQRSPAGEPAELPAAAGDAGDDLRGPDRGRSQGRPAEPGGAGRHLRRRKAVAQELQDSGHLGHYRRAHRRHRRNRIHGRGAHHSGLCAARAATGGRLGRLAQAQPRPPRAGHPGSASRSSPTSRSPSSRTISRRCAKWI